MFWINLIGTLISLVLGFYILFLGRRVIWVSLGIITFFATANLVGVLVADLEGVRAIVNVQAWNILAIAAGAAVLGVVLGRARPELAVLLIGFAAGADLARWFYEISFYVITTLVEQSEQVALWIGLVVILIGGLLGVWLVRQKRNEALILITMLVGTQIIRGTLQLDQGSSWTAIFMIILALAGVLVQYADALREERASQVALEPHPSSVAYFQNLELDGRN